MSALRNLTQWESTDIYRYEYDGANIIYIGRARAGASESANIWRIEKRQYSGSSVTATEYANGSPAYFFSWTLRASYEYPSLPDVVTDLFLLEDGSSHILLEDGVSRLALEA